MERFFYYIRVVMQNVAGIKSACIVTEICQCRRLSQKRLDTNYLVKALEQSIYSQQQNAQEESEELTEEIDDPEEGLQMSME